MRRRWLPAVVGLVLLVGCGGGGSGASRAPATTTTTRPTVEADKTRATRALLTAVDLPGYTEKTADNSPDPSDAAFKACLGNDPVLTRDETSDPRHAVGKELDKGTSFVASEAVVAESEDQARAAVVRLRGPDVPACFANGLAGVKDPDVSFANTTAKPLATATAGDETAGLRVVTTATSGTVSLKFTIDFEVARRDRALALLTTSATGAGFGDAERTALAQKMVERLTA
ncbi:MAG: hypothetical protein ACR2LJ_10975 [Acidimicrobiales bacterium]